MGFDNLYQETEDLLTPPAHGFENGAISTLLQLKPKNGSHVSD